VNNYGCFGATVDPLRGVSILTFDSISEFDRQTPRGQEICLIADICLLRAAFRCADLGVKPKTKYFNLVTLPKALASEQVIVARAAHFLAPVSFRSAQVRSRSAGTSWCPATARRPSPRASGTSRPIAAAKGCPRLHRTCQRIGVFGPAVFRGRRAVAAAGSGPVRGDRRPGAIGVDLAQAPDRGIPGYVLTSVSARDLPRDRLASLTVAVACVRLDELEGWRIS
jgi:hypothetical protein